MILQKLTETLAKYQKYNDTRYALISLNDLLTQSTIEELRLFADQFSILLPSISEKTNVINAILSHFFEVFEKRQEISQKYADPLQYFGHSAYGYLPQAKMPYLYDFVSKTELMNVFADYCADLGITVYRPQQISDYHLDMFLTKKVKAVFSVTESVFVRTAKELTPKAYEVLLGDIARSTLIAEWKVFVTTPAGALKIGFDKLLADMKRVHTWLYIIDPIQKQVYGITKGSKSKSMDSDLQDRYIKNLPHTPFRTPSQVVDLSDYEFEERKAYKPKHYRMFRLDEKLVEDLATGNQSCNERQYAEIFQSLIIMDKISGLTMYSYSKSQISDQLVSGFLSAIDSFVQKLSGSTNMEEINYQGFMINAGVGEQVKIIAILQESTDAVFKERLNAFTALFEDLYHEQILEFRHSGDQEILEHRPLEILICNMLSL